MQVPSEYYDHDDGLDHCPACGRADFELVHRPDHFGFEIAFYKCRCGLFKQVPMPNEAFFDWFFNSELFYSARKEGEDEIWGFYDYFADEPSRYKTSQRRYRRLSKLLGWTGRREIMKIGPATGTFLHAAQQNGHHAVGCDVSNDFVAYARDTYGVRIDQGRFERMGYAEGGFDDILLFNVIENVPNVEELLAEINRTLKEGGNLILNHVEMTSNILAALQRDKYFIFRPPVCYVFEGRALERLLEQYGFRVKLRLRDIRYLHLEKMATLLRWRWLLKLAKLLRMERINFPIWAYPSWIVVAEKTASATAR